jgi:hypothetical protein
MATHALFHTGDARCWRSGDSVVAVQALYAGTDHQLVIELNGLLGGGPRSRGQDEVKHDQHHDDHRYDGDQSPQKW